MGTAGSKDDSDPQLKKQRKRTTKSLKKSQSINSQASEPRNFYFEPVQNEQNPIQQEPKRDDLKSLSQSTTEAQLYGMSKSQYKKQPRASKGRKTFDIKKPQLFEEDKKKFAEDYLSVEVPEDEIYNDSRMQSIIHNENLDDAVRMQLLQEMQEAILKEKYEIKAQQRRLQQIEEEKGMDMNEKGKYHKGIYKKLDDKKKEKISIKIQKKEKIILEKQRTLDIKYQNLKNQRELVDGSNTATKQEVILGSKLDKLQNKLQKLNTMKAAIQ